MPPYHKPNKLGGAQFTNVYFAPVIDLAPSLCQARSAGAEGCVTGMNGRGEGGKGSEGGEEYRYRP